MEETLTDCLVRVREDLNNLKRVRDYLDSKTETGHCSITWRTIEAFNSILGVCSSQHTPQTNALDILLDSFYHLAKNNTDPSVWNDFGFELGIICVKVLSAIERTEVFEVLFCKLLTVVSVICEHNSNVWKAAARQILNVLINKKFSFTYFERVIKLYLCTLRNIESVALLNFSSQNLHLLRTLSKLVQKVGDFEIQSDIMELVFLHLKNNKQSMLDFFATSESNLFESLQFVDFEADCRTYLNALNKPRGGLERKVYSVCCHVLYLGGCFVEPPVGTNSLWVDANKETERLSIRCADFESEGNRVIYFQFSDILRVQLTNKKTQGNRRLTIQMKSLWGLQFDVKNEDICLMIENGEALFEFVNFLNEQIRTNRKLGGKVSRTRDLLVIDRNRTERKEKVQDNAITSSEKRGIDHILPDILNLFQSANHTPITSTEVQIKTSQSSRVLSTEIRTPSRPQNVVFGSQELSPNSFIESLNKHIGRDSLEAPRTFEDSVETIEFLQRSIPGGGHQARSSDAVLDGVKTEELKDFSFIFDEEKENKPIAEKVKPKLKTYERKREKPKPSDNPPNTMVLRDRKNLQLKLANTQSQDYFQHSANVLKKRKPSLPKLKRSSKAKNQKAEVRESKVEDEQEIQRTGSRKSLIKNERERRDKEARSKGNLEKLEIGCQQKQHNSDLKQRKSPGEKMVSGSRNKKHIPRIQPNSKSRSKLNMKREIKPLQQQQFQLGSKPSLLDPNGYTYRRWCEPTTSERSNFWLKKLNAVQELKTHPDNVFNFSEDSDSPSAKNKRKKRRIVHSKRKSKTKEVERTSLKQVREILRRTSPKVKQNVSPRRTHSEMHSRQVLQKSPELFRGGWCDAKLQQPVHVSKHGSSPESTSKNRAKESINESDFSKEEEDEDPLARIKKRERSFQETSLIKTHTKKKVKMVGPSGKFLSILRHRLLRKEEEDKHQTDEIIRTVNKAINHLFNHVQRKEGQKVLSYLSAAEETVAAVEADVDSLSLRAKRTQRAMLYFQAGCSVSDLCESLEGHFSGVRSALRDFQEKRDVSSMISRVNERLMGLIKSEIDKSIDSEFTSRRNRLLKCASLFNVESGGFL